MALLQSQMTRYHQQVRPRYSNPTYASTNVGSTLGMHAPYIFRHIQNSYSTLKPATFVQPIQSRISTPKKRSSSQLSNIGTSSLKSLNKYISDKEIYEKQRTNYNIISVQPKEYQDTIKIFPKYRLENEDRNYYRKMKLEQELANKINIKKETTNPEKEQKKPKRGKYLNHVDQVTDIM